MSIDPVHIAQSTPMSFQEAVRYCAVVKRLQRAADLSEGELHAFSKAILDSAAAFGYRPLPHSTRLPDGTIHTEYEVAPIALALDICEALEK